MILSNGTGGSVLLVAQRERATVTWDRTICGTQDQAARRELLAAIRAHATQNGNPESRATSRGAGGPGACAVT
jgi:hypothetical protein